MSLVKNIDAIVEWTQATICTKIQLKVPDDDNNDDAYEPQLVNPAAFGLYMPAKDRLPPNIRAPIPSVVVQLMEGDERPTDGAGRLKVRFCLACWNPGDHKDRFIPFEDPTGTHRRIYHYDKLAGETYARSFEGWRDSWNFADIALRELENTEYIGGLRLVKELGLSFGPFVEDGVIWDYYPYWHSWIAVTLEYGLRRKTPDAYKVFL
jgi:hypothetical protein